MNKKEAEASFRTVSLIVWGIFLDWFGKQLTKLTKYFPFSLITERWYLHYNNRDIMMVEGVILNAWDKLGVYFKIKTGRKDEIFIRFNGYFKLKPGEKRINKFKLYLEKELGESNVFFREQEDNTFNIDVIRSGLELKS